MEKTFGPAVEAARFDAFEELQNIAVPEGFLQEFDQRVAEIRFVRREAGVLHNSYEWAEALYQSVRNGDRKGLSRFLVYSERLWRIGKLGPDDVRSCKNACLCLVSYIVQRTLQDELGDTEMLYATSDACIQLIEETQTRQEAVLRTYASMVKLTELLQDLRKTPYHHLVRRARDYVNKHVHDRLKAADVAAALGVSAAHLSRVFQEVEHQTLKAYIQDVRVREAKELLRYSSDSIQTIAQYLGFASQSHLTEVFRQSTGMTPLQYRNRFSELYRSGL